MSTLVIDCSPREGGNSDIIREHITDHYEVDCITLREYEYSPCNGCGYCEERGMCRHNDSARDILEEIMHHEDIIFVAPTYFYSFDAHTKALIDRAQYLWSSSGSRERNRRLYLIAVGGQCRDIGYNGMVETLRCFGITIGAQFVDGRYFGNVDKRGEIQLAGRIEELTAFLDEILTK